MQYSFDEMQYSFNRGTIVPEKIAKFGLFGQNAGLFLTHAMALFAKVLFGRTKRFF